MRVINAHGRSSALGIPGYETVIIIFRIVFIGLMISLNSPINFFGETIDRIVAVVNNQIITLSDLEEEESFYQLDHQLPSSNKDNGTEKKAIQRELIERMIEKLLLSEQIVGFPGSKITDEEIETQLNALQEKWGGKDQLDQMLLDSHTTRKELKEHLRWQILILKHVDNRFRQFAVVDPAEIAKYYQETLIPEMERKGIRQFPPQADVEAKIREILTEEKVNQAIEEWLTSLKETANIHIFE
jgi:peptidyl-prolyl cis-trans isomerase SurA